VTSWKKQEGAQKWELAAVGTVLPSVQPCAADSQGLADPRRVTGDESVPRCAEHYWNQKHSVAERRLGHPWQQRCRQTHGQHKILQLVPPLSLSWCGESTPLLPPDPLSPHPLMDAGTFHTTTSTLFHTQKTLCFPINNGYSLENKEQQTTSLPAAYN